MKLPKLSLIAALIAMGHAGCQNTARGILVGMYKLTPADTYEYAFDEGVRVDDYTAPKHRAQTIKFEKGIPESITITIDDTPLENYKNPEEMHYSTPPVDFGDEGGVVITYQWSVPHKIVISKNGFSCALPMSPKELKQLFGKYRSKESSVKIL